MSSSCAPVKFCSPPNWKVDFPDLVGEPGPAGADGPPGRDAPTELKANLFGPIQDLEVYDIDGGAWEPYQVYGIFAYVEVGSATISILVDGAPVPGLTNLAVTTEQQQFLASATNTVTLGGKLQVQIVDAPFGTKTLIISAKTQQIPA